MSYYERHIFFCLNQRTGGEAACAQHDAQSGFDQQRPQLANLIRDTPARVLALHVVEYSREVRVVPLASQQ